MFDSYFEHVRYIPEQVVVCGPNIMKYGCDDVLQNKLGTIDTQYSSVKSVANCIYIK